MHLQNPIRPPLATVAGLLLAVLFGLLLGRSCSTGEGRSVQILSELVRDLTLFQYTASIFATGIVAAATILAAIAIPFITVRTFERHHQHQPPHAAPLVATTRKPDSLKAAEPSASALDSTPDALRLPERQPAPDPQPAEKGNTHEADHSPQ